MKGTNLTESELSNIAPGEALTLTVVMAIVAVAVATVVIYRLMKGKEGTVKVPGGWQFTWE
ncbi:MAG: hypothetical protein K5694_07175 [Bacilli bacterium]|nr:hypothetical protein [Bacilli bacterium]